MTNQYYLLGLSLLAIGACLTIGPILVFTFYQKKQIPHSSMEDLIDDDAKRRGTFLFVLGGISFIFMGLLTFILAM